MKSDTIIGIVGAVVLVSVMVGVFAYEYNNAPAEDPTPTADEMMRQQASLFNDTYGPMAAFGDIDGDGIQNYNDTDMDGDGLNDTMDDAIKVVRDVGGSLQQGADQSASQTHAAESGLIHVKMVLGHDATVSGQNVGALDVRLIAPDGSSYSVSPVAEGDRLVYTYELMAEPPAGDYTVSVRHAGTGPLQIGPAVTFTGELMFHYVSPDVEA